MTERSPTFIFLGPGKVGSTWLHTVLAQHPDCSVPPIKDLRFFSDYYGHGAAWYLKHFRHAEPRHLAVGELSNEYLAHPDAPQHIRETLVMSRSLPSCAIPSTSCISPLPVPDPQRS